MEDVHGLGGQVGRECAALDRLHHEDGLAVLAAHLVVLAGLDTAVFPVEVVDLQLHELGVGPAVEQFVEVLGVVVVREAQATDLAGVALLAQEVPRVGAVGVDGVLSAKGMQQVVVEVLHAAFLKLLLEDALLVAVLLDEGAGQLVGQHVGVAVVAFHEGFAHGTLAGALMVEVEVVEVSETSGEILVHHLTHERYINRSGVCRVGQRQTHAAKAELLHVGHTGPLPCVQITMHAIVARQKVRTFSKHRQVLAKVERPRRASRGRPCHALDVPQGPQPRQREVRGSSARSRVTSSAGGTGPA